MSAETLPAAPVARRERRVLRVVASVAFYAMVAGLAWLVWPSSLGGCTTFTVVSGHSMEPLYRTGDIVVARCGKPEVGDIVVYRPTGIEHARIIHRIVGGTSAGWTMRGDNNDFVDSFSPSDDEVVGIAKVHIPKLAYVGDLLTSPFVWGGLILLALALMVWPRGDDEEEPQEAAADARADDDAPVEPEESPDDEPEPSDDALDPSDDELGSSLLAGDAR